MHSKNHSSMLSQIKSNYNTRKVYVYFSFFAIYMKILILFTISSVMEASSPQCTCEPVSQRKEVNSGVDDSTLLENTGKTLMNIHSSRMRMVTNGRGGRHARRETIFFPGASGTHLTRSRDQGSLKDNYLINVSCYLFDPEQNLVHYSLRMPGNNFAVMDTELAPCATRIPDSAFSVGCLMPGSPSDLRESIALPESEEDVYLLQLGLHFCVHQLDANNQDDAKVNNANVGNVKSVDYSTSSDVEQLSLSGY